MEIKIIKEEDNPVIGRKEVQCVINHLGEQTPTRESVQSNIAAQLNTDKEFVVIQSIEGHFGEPISQVVAHCYNEKDDVLRFEPKFRLKRNKLVE